MMKKTWHLWIFLLAAYLAFTPVAWAGDINLSHTGSDITNESNWSYDSTDQLFTVTGDVTVTGTSAGENRIAVAASVTATIILNGVTLEVPSITATNGLGSALFLDKGANVTLKWVAGTANRITNDGHGAGIDTTRAALTIEGPDSGKLYVWSKNGGAGIGGVPSYDPDGYYSSDNGTITINSGTIESIGAPFAAGIGGGERGAGGNITINGGTVKAYGNYKGAGIGGGAGGAGGTIKITGGKVTATSNFCGAGIGGGAAGFSGNITIGSNATVTADGGGSDELINGGINTGSGAGAGIGSGGGIAYASGYHGDLFDTYVPAGEVGTIDINPGAQVNAKGGGGGDSGAGEDIGSGGPCQTAEGVKRTVTASAGSGGTIYPSGAVQIIEGAGLDLSVTLKSGYSIASVKVDGNDDTLSHSEHAAKNYYQYFFPNVTENHTIEVTFAPESGTVINAQAPVIGIQPKGAAYTQYAAPHALTVAASSPDGGQLSYKWYGNGAAITGAEGSSYTPYTSVTGTTDYYVVVTNAIGNNGDGGIKTAQTKSLTATVVVDPAAVGPIDPNNHISMGEGGSIKFNLNADASGTGWRWDAANRILMLYGTLMGPMIHLVTEGDVGILVTDETTAANITKTGAGSLGITVEADKTLTLTPTAGPGISAEGPIVLGTETIVETAQGLRIVRYLAQYIGAAQSAEAAENAGKIVITPEAGNTSPAIQSTNDSVSIVGGIDVSAASNGGSAVNARTKIGISTSGVVEARTTGAGYALEAGEIEITNGTTRLFAADDEHAFNVEPAYSGANTTVTANEKTLFEGDGGSEGDDGGGGCNAAGTGFGALALAVLALVKWRG